MMLLINDPHDPERFQTRCSRYRDRWLVGVFARALDQRLSSGEPPESSGLLARRAQTLVLVETRRALARDWEHLLRVAHGRAATGVPLRRQCIIAAEPDIADMLRALVTELPTPARGVAMAHLLLRDGAGPLYNAESPVDLGTAVRDATTQLDPWTSLGQFGLRESADAPKSSS